MKFSRRDTLRGLAATGAAAALTRSPFAFGQAAVEKTYVIELCMRDQVDFGHVMVAPGLAVDANLRRGENGRACALFHSTNTLIQRPNRVYLTPESTALDPHIDSVAVMELAELSYGPVHGHEAGNPLRSPGRSLQSAGKIAMWNGEPGQQSGEGPTYSNTPTIVSLHNAWLRTVAPTRLNGIAIKGTDRMHAIYHFGAGLTGSELTRFQTTNALLQAFPTRTEANTNVLKTAAEADAVRDVLGKLDKRALEARGLSTGVLSNHASQLADARNLNYRGEPKTFTLALTPAERAEWSAGVPAKYGRTTIDVWEQMAYAFKLVSNDVVASVALEVDIGDVHGERTAPQMKQQTELMVVPLARLISKLKAAGLYDRTLIIISTSDGGRSPAAGSSGDEGKNGVILAGGMIKGGYYGDITAGAADGNGQKYRYHMPDIATGAPIPNFTEGNDRRLPAGHLWRTMAKALRIPDAFASQFADVRDTAPLGWMLKS